MTRARQAYLGECDALIIAVPERHPTSPVKQTPQVKASNVAEFAKNFGLGGAFLFYTAGKKNGVLGKRANF